MTIRNIGKTVAAIGAGALCGIGLSFLMREVGSG